MTASVLAWEGEMSAVRLGRQLYDAYWERNKNEGQQPTPFFRTARAIQLMWFNIASDALALMNNRADVSL
jgi:hypothetical protein